MQRYCNAEEHFLGDICKLISEVVAEDEKDVCSASKSTNLKQPQPTMLETVKGFFNESRWNFNLISEKSAIYFTYQGENGKWVVIFSVHEATKQLAVYSLYPDKIQKCSQLRLAELASRINTKLLAGNFEMDFDNDDLRYRVGLDVRNCKMTSALIKQLLVNNIRVMDYYLPCWQSVASSEMSVLEVFAKYKQP